MKARSTVGRRGKRLLSDPGPELRLGNDKEKGKKRLKIKERMTHSTVEVAVFV